MKVIDPDEEGDKVGLIVTEEELAQLIVGIYGTRRHDNEAQLPQYGVKEFDIKVHGHMYEVMREFMLARIKRRAK